jgi:ferredoxin
VEIRAGHPVGAVPEGFDAMVVATGSPAPFADGPRVVACGNARFEQPTRLAVRSVADGIAAAHAVATLLGGPPAPPRRFDSRRRAVSERDLATFVRRAATKAGRARRDDPVAAEALRCLDCDCAKSRTCRLRAASDALGGDRLRYASAGDGARVDAAAAGPAVEIAAASTGLSLETGKCIRCGRCVRIAAAAGDRPGLAFSGRGPDLRVRVPFGDPLEGALPTSAAACVAACPTGALAWDAGGRKEHEP